MAHPDTPWWSNLIAVIVTGITASVLTLLVIKGGVAQGTPEAAQKLGGFMSLVRDTFIYIPHALLLFGVIADMLTYEGVYSVASLIGLISLFLHAIVGKFIGYVMTLIADAKKAASMPSSAETATQTPPPPKTATTETQTGGAAKGSFFADYDGCDFQGFGWARTPYAPQTLVVIATIFSYYLFDLIANRGWMNSVATMVMGAVFYLAQLVLSGDCTPDSPEKVSKWIQGFFGLVEGLLFGGISYGVVQSVFPNRLPSAAISPFPKTTPNMLRDGKYDAAGNPWVCVAGNCYPDMSTAEARKNFADLAAANTGNGRAAVAEDCPAS